MSKSIDSGLHGLSLAKLSIQPDIGVPTRLGMQEEVVKLKRKLVEM
tara:strand:+ start:638 stop:775 length:138 start_codon:yes stop_codon:yes gene_type:complete